MLLEYISGGIAFLLCFNRHKVTSYHLLSTHLGLTIKISRYLTKGGSVNVGVVYTGPLLQSRMCIMNYSCHHVLHEVNGQSLKQNTMMREIHNAQCRQLQVEHSLVNQGVKISGTMFRAHLATLKFLYQLPHSLIFL